MCGLVAAIGTNTTRTSEAAMQYLTHRGSQEPTVDALTQGVLRHVRLPIVGTQHEHGDQPRRTDRAGASRVEQSRTAFVGEVFGYNSLEGRFKSDAAFVHEQLQLQRYQRVGEYGEALTGMDGFWHVAHLREVRHEEREVFTELHVFTDYLAQKPAYYGVSDDGETFVAASEPHAVAHALGMYRRANRVYLSAIMKWGYCPDTRMTPWQGVYQLRPGECVSATYNGYGPVRYRTHVSDPLHVEPYHGGVSTELIEAALQHAVDVRLQHSEVDIAMLLSGGIDSSIVYRMIQQSECLGDRQVTAYHVPEVQDTPYVARLLNECDPEQRFNVKYTPIDSPVTVDDELLYMVEPMDLGSLVPQIQLSRVVEEHVCLTGDGADELFGGYSRATRYDSQMSDVYYELPNWHFPRLDRVMMRHLTEVRSPFLARSVAELALGLPHHERQDKVMLRRIARNIDVPDEICARKKHALRTSTVKQGREQNSIRLVDAFLKSIGDEQ